MVTSTLVGRFEKTRVERDGCARDWLLELNTDVLWWPPHHSNAFERINMTWRCAFPLSGAVGVFAAVFALVEGRQRLILLPLAGVVLSFFFALFTSRWRGVF